MLGTRDERLKAASILALTVPGLCLPFFLAHPASYLPLLAAVLLTGRSGWPAIALLIALLGSLVLIGSAVVESGLANAQLSLPSLLVLIAIWVLVALARRYRDPTTEWWLSGSSFQRAFDHSPSGMALVSPALRILYANDTLADMLGRPRSELTGLPLQALVAEEDWTEIQNGHERLLTGEQAIDRGEYLLQRADGNAFWASLSTGTVTDRRGRIAFTIDHIVDLSPMQRTERALRESEARFRGITEHSTAVTMIIDAAGHASYVNPAFLRLLGVTVDRVLGESPTDFLVASDRAEFEHMLLRTQAQQGTSFALPHLRLERDNGTPIFLDAKITGLYATPGIQGAVLNGQEVTGQIRAERALRRSETRFAALFDTSRDAILLIRASDGATLDFNAAFTLLTGCERRDGLGRHRDELLRVADSADIDRLFELLETDNQVVDLETVLITNEGRARETSIAGRYAELDGELCVVLVLRDISERRRTEAALKESEDKFSRVFHRSPDAMLITRLGDGVIIDVNDNFVELLQRDRADMVGRSVRDLEPHLPLGGVREHWQLIEDDDASGYANVEIDIESSDGLIPTLASTTVVDIQGDPCAITLIKDMRELRRAQVLVQESEERFRGAFENAPIGMMLVSPEGRVTQVNRILCDLLHQNRGDLIGTLAEELMPTEERADYVRLRTAMLAGETEELASSQARYLTRTGFEVWTNRHMVVQRAADGRPLYLIIQVADITEMKQTQARMERLAFYDTLTDLANRRLFHDRLEQAIRHATRTALPTALLYLDLDNFKRVNDTLGHEAGDLLLQTVAERLRDCVRSEDTVGRPGGDEFNILLHEVQDARAAGQVARKILKKLKEPITLGSHEIRVTTSIGITLAPDDGADPATLTKNADLAMYRAKERGRDNYQFFAEDMNNRAMERLTLENDLRSSLAAGQFELFYQPKVRLATNEIIGLEALLRWNHPERGVLRPGQFMQLAEESGLIVEIGQWVLEQACLDAQRLQQQVAQPLHVAVNLSARQFTDPGLPGRVERALQTAGLDATHLELEITETMLTGDIEDAIKTLDTLRRLGVRLAIDDFGTGYSSLSYLKRLPIDLVKVDQSFIADLPGSSDDMAITKAVIAMAHQLNMEVVAEGVENAAQRDFLVAHGCEFGQGYLFGRPTSHADVVAFVNEALCDPAALQKSSSNRSSSGGSPS